MNNKLLRSILFLAVIVVIATFLFACSLDVSDTDVYLSRVTVETSHEGDYVIGRTIDLSEITVKAYYSNGDVRAVPLTDAMLSADDRDKFFTIGVHTVTVVYEGKEAVFSIKVVDESEVRVYRAQFFSNGGSDIPTQTTDTITEFLAPTREGYTFDGWYAAHDFSGSKAIAPYVLKKDTDFYAKWVDNRRCTVTFMDEGEVYDELQVVYGDSIDITDLNLFPAPPRKVGKNFSGWKLVSGSTTEITRDAVIEASYTNIICTVQITYWDDETDKLVEDKPYLRNYGDAFNVSTYTMPTEEGHSSRWVYYTQSDNYTAYHEMEGAEITVTESIKIRPLHVINTYAVTIYNGIEESSQSDADLKSGDIKLEHIYSDPTTYTDFMVEYNNNFIISAYTQEPYLKTPRAMVGYNVYWCFVTTTLAGEIWRNVDNKVWNETTQSFEVPDGEEATTNFDLLDGEGNYVAHVKDGDIYNVKGNVTVKAKYVKKKYTVRLYRLAGGNWEKIGEFSDQVYRSDFKLYDPDVYSDPSLSAWTDVESYYLKHNVVSWSKDNDVTDDWRSVYYNVDNGNPDDWAIEWYSASTQAQDKRVDFAENAGSLGYYEIRDNLDLYCKDIDLRRYSVYIKYNYNFATGDYDSTFDCGMLAENDPIEKRAEWEASVTRYYPDHNNESVTYTFVGWYDYPYEPDGNGTTGEWYRSLDTRNRNMIYYAHYNCDTVYTVTISDKTQSIAYDGTTYQGKGYDVAEDQPIIYSVPAGSTFSLDMIYKGRQTLGGYLPGSGFYAEASFMYYVLGTGGKASPNGQLTTLYNEKLHEYDPDTDDYNVAVAALDALISNMNERIENYTLMLGEIYSYGYAGDPSFTKEYFATTFLTQDEYNAARRLLRDYHNDKDLLTTYADQLALAESYYDKNEADASNGGLYKRYADSYIDLNAAYGKDVTDVNVKAKYRFAGWYLDPEYTELFIADYRDMDFSWFASNSYFAGRQNTQLDLYAKWADEEKGSEGLVFRAVYDNNGDQIGVVVVDYIDKAEYENSSFFGCGFNNFDQYEYSVNFNDSGVMPVDLGNVIEVQIPASHGGTGMAQWPVLGILKDAFIRHGDKNGQKIVSIDLPDSVAFIEEGALHGCEMLEIISGTGDESYLYIAEQRVVYQWNDYSAAYLKDNGALSLINITSKNLIAYAPKVRGNESVDKTVLAVRAGTHIISDYAFFGASDLLYVALSNELTSIGVSAFENSGLAGSAEGNGNKLVLPATLTTIKDYALRNCIGIKDFEGGTGLVRIGREALATTGWYTSKVGIIAINNLVVGLRDPDMDDVDKDGDMPHITVINGVNKLSYTNEYGVVYYDADGGSYVTDVVLSAAVTGITDYAFCATDKLEASQIKTVTIMGTLNNGVSGYAFRNCVNLTDVVADNLSNTSVLDHTAFVAAGKVTVHVSNIGALDISWRSYGDVTVVED